MQQKYLSENKSQIWKEIKARNIVGDLKWSTKIDEMRQKLIADDGVKNQRVIKQIREEIKESGVDSNQIQTILANNKIEANKQIPEIARQAYRQIIQDPKLVRAFNTSNLLMRKKDGSYGVIYSRNFHNDLIDTPNLINQLQGGSDLDFILDNDENVSFSDFEFIVLNSGKKASGFFKYYIKPEFYNQQYSKLAIFENYNEANYQHNCLLNAFNILGMSVEKQYLFKKMEQFEFVLTKQLRKIAKTLGITIIYIDVIKRTDQQQKLRKGKAQKFNFGEEEYTIYSYDSHFFPHVEIPDIDDHTKQYTSIKLIQTLFKDPTKYMIEIPIEDLMKQRESYNSKLLQELNAYQVREQDCVKYETKTKPQKPQKRKIIYFDYETLTNGTHQAFQVAFCSKTMLDNYVPVQCFTGENCTQQMLKYITSKSMDMLASKDSDNLIIMYAHNAQYDFSFLLNHLKIESLVSKAGQFYSARCKYYPEFKNKQKYFNIEIRDSYKLLPKPLRELPDFLQISVEKEIYPYSINKTDNMDRIFIPFSEIHDFDDKKKITLQMFIDRCEQIGCKNEDSFDWIKYSEYYCKRDVEVLCKSVEKLDQIMIEQFNMSVHQKLTISSLADQYMKDQGCYDDVYQLSGLVRMFIQKCIVGGRVMCKQNKKQQVNSIVDDFDAVSLYPSAIKRLQGFLKGKPKLILDHQKNLNFLNTVSAYFIKIKITKINKHLAFPLLSKCVDGIRTFLNDELIGEYIYVDNITLEDFIQYQQGEFEIICGYYFNDGFNSKQQITINKMFNLRLTLKKAGHSAAQEVVKLMMNSCYGKSILKPSESKNVIVYNNKFDDFIQLHSNQIISYSKYPKFTIFKLHDVQYNHFNFAHIGCQILSMSKRIMNEVMCLGEQNEIVPYYQDTDSMHIDSNKIQQLSSLFKQTYGRDLIGSGLGQFHSDFAPIVKGGQNPQSHQSLFLAKKTYVDLLVDNEGNTGYHIRMKGIPSKNIKKHCQKHNITPIQLYQHLEQGNEIQFDLCQYKCRFSKTKQFEFTTLQSMTRTVRF